MICCHLNCSATFWAGFKPGGSNTCFQDFVANLFPKLVTSQEAHRLCVLHSTSMVYPTCAQPMPAKLLMATQLCVLLYALHMLALLTKFPASLKILSHHGPGRSPVLLTCCSANMCSFHESIFVNMAPLGRRLLAFSRLSCSLRSLLVCVIAKLGCVVLVDASISFSEARTQMAFTGHTMQSRIHTRFVPNLLPHAGMLPCLCRLKTLINCFANSFSAPQLLL